MNIEAAGILQKRKNTGIECMLSRECSNCSHGKDKDRDIQ